MTQKTAWFMLHRIREAWAHTSGERFAGPVEIDETYVGGKAKNMHAWERREKIHGRGGKDKAVLVAVKDRPTNRIVARQVPNKKGPTLVGVLSDAAPKGAIVYTDEHKAYCNLGRLGYGHKIVVHSRGQYVAESAHVNGIESFWSMFKRGYHGTFHQLSEAHLHRYVAEFAGRHNMRPLGTVEQMGLVAEGMVGKRLRYADLVATPDSVGASIPVGDPF